MVRRIVFTPTANAQLTALEKTPSQTALLKQVRKALGYLEIDPHHPGLQTHEFTSLSGVHGEKVFEAYAQNNTPGAYRIFWHYGPDEIKRKKRVSVITIIAITRHSKLHASATLSRTVHRLSKPNTFIGQTCAAEPPILLSMKLLARAKSQKFWPPNCSQSRICTTQEAPHGVF
jgi:hypothetical protein